MREPPTFTGPAATGDGDRLRHLTACPACRAQYDVSGLELGSRFHCACGEVVTVAAAQPHGAAVVRCSACGAPRQGRASGCGFCGSDFTVHERDLHTICPGCAARISDRARFCHGCGLAISVVSTAAEATGKACPACGGERRLTSRELGGAALTVLECRHCAGLWLGAEAFRLVERRARERQATASPAAPAPEPAGAGGGRAYRPCPECGKLMHRRNYGRRSGVIVDHCGRHGWWFDRGELERVLRWIGDGGLSRSEEIEATKRRQEARLRAPAARVGTLFEPRASSAGRGGLIGALVEFLSSFR